MGDDWYHGRVSIKSTDGKYIVLDKSHEKEPGIEFE
jgi:hypothetical protein